MTEELSQKEKPEVKAVPPITAESVVNESDAVRKEVERLVDSGKIDGRTQKEWSTYFRIDVPTDIDMGAYIALCAKVDRLQQIAYYYLSRAERVSSLTATLKKRKYNAEVDTVIAEAKSNGTRVPAAGTVAAIAENQIASVSTAENDSLSRVKFWRRRTDSLDMTHQTLKSLGYLLSEEARMIPK